MTMHWIAGQTATSGTQVFSFTNIPQNFNHLQLRIYARSTFNGGENLFLRFNNTASYSFAGHLIRGDGASTASGAYTSSNYSDLIGMVNASHSANIFGVYVMDIFDYSSTTKNKTIKVIGGGDFNGSGFVELKSSLCVTTDAITDIHQVGGTAAGPSFGLVAGSRADLYGITTNPIATGA